MQFDIIGAQCLRPDGFDHERLSVSDGCFVEAPQHRRVDLDGYWVMPGIVDIHGDGFERHLAPRRGAVSDLAAGLVAVEAELAALILPKNFYARTQQLWQILTQICGFNCGLKRICWITMFDSLILFAHMTSRTWCLTTMCRMTPWLPARNPHG